MTMCLINDGIEETEHFLLQLHAYSEQRCDLLGAINEVLLLHNISNLFNQVLVRTMLYGDIRFTYNQNRQILEATVHFIRTQSVSLRTCNFKLVQSISSSSISLYYY